MITRGMRGWRGLWTGIWGAVIVAHGNGIKIGIGFSDFCVDFCIFKKQQQKIKKFG